MASDLHVFEYDSRDAYLGTQVRRSEAKFGYCKVFLEDVIRYRELLALDRAANGDGSWSPDPILCLGVRSGVEVDLFRTGFFAPLLRTRTAARYLARLDRDKSAERKMALCRRLGRGAGEATDGRAVGVELNPACRRSDVHVGSFDDLPGEWEGRFRLLFSNSFDHSQDPARTVAEWRRVAAPGAYVIIGFIPGAPASDTDPTGGLSLEALMALWSAPLVFASQTMNRNGYFEACFRLD